MLFEYPEGPIEWKTDFEKNYQIFISLMFILEGGFGIYNYLVKEVIPFRHCL